MFILVPSVPPTCRAPVQRRRWFLFRCCDSWAMLVDIWCGAQTSIDAQWARRCGGICKALAQALARRARLSR